MLSAREVDLLFAQIVRLRARGVGIIYISHRIDETRRIADTISVLRDGAVVATGRAADMSTPELVRLMTGRDLGARIARAAPCAPAGAADAAVALRVEGISRGDAVRDVSFSAHAGEILGIAGLVGAGRTETLRLIYGADRADSGRVVVGGRVCAPGSPAAAVRAGIGMVMEDRKEQGLLLRQPIRVNLTLSDIGKLARHGWLDRAREAMAARDIGHRMALRSATIEQAAGELSGGNQQKVAIGRWLHRPCAVLLLDEPTRGIDVGAKADIYALLAGLAAQGKALVVVSSELNELLLLCDRIAVMSAGRLVRTFERAEATQEAILAAAFSGYADAAPAAASTPSSPLPFKKNTPT
jgi:ribose transport system ATP-binding protein